MVVGSVPVSDARIILTNSSNERGGAEPFGLAAFMPRHWFYFVKLSVSHNADNLRFALWSKPVDLVCSTSAMSDEKSQEEQDRQVEIWKMKKLIKTLTESRGFVVVLQQRSLELCHDGEFDSLQERNQYDFSGNPSW